MGWAGAHFDNQAVLLIGGGVLKDSKLCTVGLVVIVTLMFVTISWLRFSVRCLRSWKFSYCCRTPLATNHPARWNSGSQVIKNIRKSESKDSPNAGSSLRGCSGQIRIKSYIMFTHRATDTATSRGKDNGWVFLSSSVQRNSSGHWCVLGSRPEVSFRQAGVFPVTGKDRTQNQFVSKQRITSMSDILAVHATSIVAAPP